MKNVVVCIFIISFVFGYSQSKDTNIKIIKNPLYNLEIKAFHCSIELWINDIVVFNHYEEKGSIWVDWPINQFILQKGNQNFEVRIIPYKNQTTLSEKVEEEFNYSFLFDDKKVLNPMPQFDVVFYGNGKLVRLEKIDDSSEVITLTGKTDDGFEITSDLNVILHMPKGNKVLEQY